MGQIGWGCRSCMRLPFLFLRHSLRLTHAVHCPMANIILTDDPISPQDNVYNYLVTPFSARVWTRVTSHPPAAMSARSRWYFHRCTV